LGIIFCIKGVAAASHFNCQLVLRKMNFPKTPECFSNDPRLLKDNVGEDRLLLPNGNRMHPDFGFYLKIAHTPRFTANRSRGLRVSTTIGLLLSLNVTFFRIGSLGVRILHRHGVISSGPTI
jgi:hypothetical protein